MSDESPTTQLGSSSENEVESAFVKRMRAISRKMGSASALARAAGISQGGIRRYFDGGEPSRPHLVALAEAAGVSVEWLATGKEPTREPLAVHDGGAPNEPKPVDLDLLEEVVRVLRSQLEQRRLRLEPAGEARAVRLLYQIHSKRHDPVEADAVAEVINLAAHR